MPRASKECSFCRKENFVADTRYFYDSVAGIYLYVCYDCLTPLVFKEWASRETVELRGSRKGVNFNAS